MSSSENKIVTKLSRRRQIEADLREMGNATSEGEFRRQARQIAALGTDVIPVIVGNLDRANGALLAAMGSVAVLLDRAEVVHALRQVLLQPQRSGQSRMAAITLLERFLGEVVEQELRPADDDAAAHAVSALEAVMEQADSAPAVLADYVRALDRQVPDVALAVIEALGREPGLKAVELLRMMVQDVRQEIAAAALEALGAIRLPQAAEALQTLVPILAPTLMPRAERLLRKLQFSGVDVRPLPAAPEEWRAVISPPDGLGQQNVWFIEEEAGTSQARVLNILLSDGAGTVEALGHPRVSAVLLPPRRGPGTLHDIGLASGPAGMFMMEVGFDVGRRLLVEALARNRETQIPVAGVLRWLCPWLWGTDASRLPAQVLPHLAPEDAKLVSMSDRLVAHPALLNWTARSDLTQQAAEEALRRTGWDLQHWVRRLAGELFAEPTVAPVLRRRLVALSEWLLLAGDEMWSRVALVTAGAMLEERPQQLPFVQALVQRDLEMALASLRQPLEPGDGSETG